MKILEPIPTNEDCHIAQPERLLWLAVLERALKDYCYFFHRLCGADQGDRILRSIDKYKGHKIGYNYRKVCFEYDRLNWFLFDKTLEPFNLEYICQQLYDDGPGMAQSFRREAKKTFNRHVIDSKAETVYPTILAYIRQYTNEPIVEGEPLDPDCLRWKRYRLFNSEP